MSLFDAHGDLVEARARLRSQVDEILAALESGRLPRPHEREQVDLKEEAGRRDRRGGVLPGERQNPQAVEQLAREVPCMANTPGGGALIVGVDDSGRVLGTELDVEWLRHRIFERVDIAPAVEQRLVRGERLLVLYVAETREPVEDPENKIRWRVGDHCVPVDRSEWWLRRQERAGLDVMAAVTGRTIADVALGALVTARRYLISGNDDETADTTDTELLGRLGVLRPDGALTQAGVLAFCPAPRTLIELTRFDVPGGDVLNPPTDLSGLALVEQLAAVESDLLAFNVATTVHRGFAEIPVRQIPPRSVREALLNGLVHRDWMRPDPITVIWFDHDHVLEVESPGGFAGGVSQDTVLSRRYARYPALSDLFRALRLVEKQGVGVDRMYREMISFGHRPPRIVEVAGPAVRTRLAGGAPVVPVMSLMESVQPAARRRDVRIAVIFYELLHRPFLTLDSAARALQTDADDARSALETACATRIDDDVLVEPYKDVWMLSAAVFRRLDNDQGTNDQGTAGALIGRGLLPYRRPNQTNSPDVVQAWLAAHDRITSGDYATLTGLTQTGANRALDRFVPDLLVRGSTTGRNAHYIAVPTRSR
ncbi:DUF5635 domain-containing protein [Frankia sp. CiP3]|uniref:DUF5635 domain-containing protein n=1 Tax=Frankia sp. CiP3 TaxID=2880971 RepID=UPI001EF5236C|nr:DUF5635 domain-containing protein [Frankia sp. CiP3]